MADIEKALQNSLYRAFCPDSVELGEYHLNILPHQKKTVIRDHLKICPHCTRELEVLQDFLQMTRSDIELPLGERLRVLIARLVEPGGTSELAPAFTPLRGEEEKMIRFVAEGYHIVLDVQEDADRPDLHVILGLLIGEDPTNFQVLLFDASQQVAQGQVDA